MARNLFLDFLHRKSGFIDIHLTLFTISLAFLHLVVDVDPVGSFEIFAEFPLFELQLVLRFAFVELLAKKHVVMDFGGEGHRKRKTYEAINPYCSIMFFLTSPRLWSLVT